MPPASRDQVLKECIDTPEALVGWRVSVPEMGEAVVVGVRKRYGRATRHVIKASEDAATREVVLRRKSSQAKAQRGLVFEPLRREF